MSELIRTVRPYTVDLIGQRLWRDGERLHVAPKSLAVLLYLIRERPRVVSKDELLDAVWPDTDVGDAVLKVTVRDIRRLLSDDARQPRYVETAHRRGYRFSAPVAYASSIGVVHDESAGAANGDGRSTSRAATLSSVARRPSPAWRTRSSRRWRASRQVLFVSGEAGIGKTSVVEAFLSGLERSGRAAVSRGQCVEQATVPEPYLAILDALSRLLKHRHRTEIAARLEALRADVGRTAAGTRRRGRRGSGSGHTRSDARAHVAGDRRSARGPDAQSRARALRRRPALGG